MDTLLLFLAVLLPLLAALGLVNSYSRNASLAIAPWTAGFALATGVLVRPGITIDLPWLLLGARIGVDETGQLFLAFTSLLWLLGGVFAQSYLRKDAALPRFFAFYLVAMAGNIGLILAHDALTFVVFFAMMSFSAYGLVTHNRDTESRQAGRTYIVLVVLGEVLIFAGLVLAALQAGSLWFVDIRADIALSPARDLIVALLLVGFGIKLGIVPLHFWLPLAHPVAPTPASAVLSGAMIKAGLLGWMRFLPLGEAVIPHWGALCIAAGFMASFYGVIIGLTQSNPKTVLAYSSVSQMGLAVVAVGSVLTEPVAWPTVSAALAVFAFHHAVSKGALFLGVGVAGGSLDTQWKRWLVGAGLMLPALALAGAPFTLGAVAKVALKQATSTGAMPWAEFCAYSLPLSSIATTLLVSRFLYLVWPRPRGIHQRVSIGMWLPWSVLVASVVGAIWILRWNSVLDPYWFKASPTLVWKNTWPIALAAAFVTLVSRWNTLRVHLSAVKIPAGDLIVPLGMLTRQLSVNLQNQIAELLTRLSLAISLRLPAVSTIRPRPAAGCTQLENWFVVGFFTLVLAAALFTLMSS